MVEAVWHGVLCVPRLVCKQHRFAPALSVPSSFDLRRRNRPGCLHMAGKRSLRDPDGVLITSVTNQGDDFSSVSAF